jgi:hypothetical protein
MLSPSLLSLGVLSLASLAQAVAFPQPDTTIPKLSPRASATFTTPYGGSTSTGMAIGVIVAIAVVVVCGTCGCCGMIWWFCARHRKNMRKIRAENDMTPVIRREETQQAPQTAHSNIAPSFGQYQDGYFDQSMGPQGQQVGRFDPKMGPQTSTTAIMTPMSAPGTPHHTGNQSPPQEHIHEMPDNPAPIAELKG